MSELPIEFEPSRRDVVYGRGGDIDLHCDVYSPPAASKRAAIIHLHGGGFRGGSKDAMAGKVQAYLRRGYVCIAAQYRLSGQAKWPAQLHDVKECIRWVRANADGLGIDPGRIALAGYSAGGHLAMMASAGLPGLEGDGGNPGVPNAVAACFAYYPQSVIRRADDGSPHILMEADATQAAHDAASPIHNVSSSAAPTVLFHGTSDVTILPESSQRLYDALTAAGVAAELHTVHGVPHEFDRHPEFAELCASIADLFFERLVIEPKTYPPFAPRAAPAGT